MSGGFAVCGCLVVFAVLVVRFKAKGVAYVVDTVRDFETHCQNIVPVHDYCPKSDKGEHENKELDKLHFTHRL